MLYGSLDAPSRRALVEDYIRESELPVGGWESFSDERRTSAPNRRSIEKFWEEPLQLLEKFDSASEMREGACWACGMIWGDSSTLERCHILPWQLGGSFDPSNFHLLCKKCHRDSEDLYGREYWTWFMYSEPGVITPWHASRVLDIIKRRSGKSYAKIVELSGNGMSAFVSNMASIKSQHITLEDAIPDSELTPVE